MPLYNYIDDRTNQIYHLWQKMNDKHEAYAIDGYKLNRIWYEPMIAIDSQVDPFDPKDFTRKTGEKRGTLGNIIDASKELSEKRKDKIGADPVKEQYLQNWSKKRKGRPHPDIQRQKAKEFANKHGVDIEF